MRRVPRSRRLAMACSRVDDQIHENSLQQPRIGVHGWQVPREAPAESSFFCDTLLLFHHLLDYLLGTERLARQRRRPRKCGNLHDPGGASSLLQHDFHLAARGVIGRALAHQVADAQNRRQRIIQFVCYACRRIRPSRRRAFPSAGLFSAARVSVMSRAEATTQLNNGLRVGARRPPRSICMFRRYSNCACASSAIVEHEINSSVPAHRSGKYAPTVCRCRSDNNDA